MELVTILRELWRLRVLVLGIALLAMLVGMALAFRLPSLESRKYEVGVATASVLVDTPNSQVIEVAPKGSDTLAMRASLLANLMAEGVVEDRHRRACRIRRTTCTGSRSPPSRPRERSPRCLRRALTPS